MRSKFSAFQKFRGFRLRQEIQQELKHIAVQPDKFYLNGLSVAQFIWPESVLKERQLGGYAHVGDAEMPNGELRKTTGKASGRKSGRPCVPEDEHNLFAGFIFQIFSSFIN